MRCPIEEPRLDVDLCRIAIGDGAAPSHQNPAVPQPQPPARKLRYRRPGPTGLMALIDDGSRGSGVGDFGQVLGVDHRVAIEHNEIGIKPRFQLGPSSLP